MRMRIGLIGIMVAILSLAPLRAAADICDYRLSRLIAERAPLLASGKDNTLEGITRDGSEFYTLVHSATGVTLLGGAEAGMIGLIPEAAGALGAISTVVANPVTGIAAGAAAIGIAGSERICTFREGITDYYEVLAVLSTVAETADPKLFQLQIGAPRKKAAVVEIWDPHLGVRKQYRVADLGFFNGELTYRTYKGPNRKLYSLAGFAGNEILLNPPSLDETGW